LSFVKVASPALRKTIFTSP